MNREAFRQLAAVEEHHWWYRGMRGTAAAVLGGEPLGDFLDAGCGTGGWAAFLGQGTAASRTDREDGRSNTPDRAFGCDFHPFAASLAAPRFRGNVARATVEALPFGDASFDTVTSIDVLYHQSVIDDSAAVAEMARVVRPGGRVLVQVPAYDWLRGRHDDDVATRERYTSATIATRLRAAGLLIERITYANAVLLPAAIAWRLAERILPPGRARDLDVPPRLLNDLALSFLQAERRLLQTRDLPAGLSVVALARRPSSLPVTIRTRQPLFS